MKKLSAKLFQTLEKEELKKVMGGNTSSTTEQCITTYPPGGGTPHDDCHTIDDSPDGPYYA